MTFVIGRPARVNMVGVPDMAVVRIVAPVAIVVEVLVSDDIAG
jgi:hypothetical protein